MGLTISLNRISFLPPPVRNNIFYEIETLGLGPPIFPLPSFKKVWMRLPPSLLGLLWKKMIGPYIWVNIFFWNIGLRPKLGKTYYHVNFLYSLFVWNEQYLSKQTAMIYSWLKLTYHFFSIRISLPLTCIKIWH
jgi:hypothetical protein